MLTEVIVAVVLLALAWLAVYELFFDDGDDDNFYREM